MTKDLEEKIRKAGFSCQLCGECCKGDESLVMISPFEIDRLCKVSKLSFEEIAEPYPEWLKFPDGREFTFGWVLRHGEDGNCIFLKETKCQVYNERPHLCRTYPFMLDGDELIISECPGVFGRETLDAKTITKDLLIRRKFEEDEFLKTKDEYQKHCNASAPKIVLDSRGAHPWKNTIEND